MSPGETFLQLANAIQMACDSKISSESMSVNKLYKMSEVLRRLDKLLLSLSVLSREMLLESLINHILIVQEILHCIMLSNIRSNSLVRLRKEFQYWGVVCVRE